VLQVSLAATVVYVAVCFVVGLKAHSLALLSEAGHNVSDAAALLLSFVAVWLGNQPASDGKTFGYQRAGVLAAFFNALALVAVSTWIAIEAVARLGRMGHGPVVATTPMMAVAAAGVVMNGLIATMLWRVSRGSGGGDVNLRSVLVHMAGDTLSTAAVIVGGFAIRLTGAEWIDPALSLGIALLILWSSISIARETLNILLEGTPRGMELPAIRAALAGIDGVEDACVVAGVADPCAGDAYSDRGYSAVGEQCDSGSREGGAERAVPDTAYDDPVRKHRLRNGTRLRDGSGCA
jgi:cobalt-zinc-cadmium efflux system protein